MYCILGRWSMAKWIDRIFGFSNWRKRIMIKNWPAVNNVYDEDRIRAKKLNSMKQNDAHIQTNNVQYFGDDI